MIKRLVKFYFSGTDTTKNIVNKIASTISSDLNNLEVVDYNFTLKKDRDRIKEFNEDDLVIAGVPTIAGRVPNLLLPYLKSLTSNGAKAAAVVLYGNRDFDDSLMELKHLLQDNGFKVIAGGAFIGEHSFSKILAKDRPDSDDLDVAEDFAHKIAQKVKNNDYSQVEVKGEWPLRPYYTPRDRHGVHIDIRKVKPKTDLEKCIDCKVCAEACPLESIDFDDVSQVPGICMKCCACIKKCPTGAKYFDDEGYLYHAHELEDLYSGTRKEPEYFV